MLTVAGGSFMSQAHVIREDVENDLVLVRVPLSPFQRSLHAGAVAENTTTGVLESFF
jgi:hypothetical protein